jgi:hypothetical protein
MSKIPKWFMKRDDAWELIKDHCYATDEHSLGDTFEHLEDVFKENIVAAVNLGTASTPRMMLDSFSTLNLAIADAAESFSTREYKWAYDQKEGKYYKFEVDLKCIPM